MHILYRSRSPANSRTPLKTLFLKFSAETPHLAAMSNTVTTPKDEGYHRLASIMAREQDLAVSRRFGFVNIISLLSLQAEVQELQEDFRDQCKEDTTSGDDEKKMYS